MTGRFAVLTAAAIIVATPAVGQEPATQVAQVRSDSAVVVSSEQADRTPPAAAKPTQSPLLRQVEIRSLRPVDQRGINVFEPVKDDAPFTGFKLNIGGAFTQQFQGLDHSNRSTAATPLVRIGHGPNNAVANLYVDAQLAKGIRVAMTSYLSSRRHQETWVKDGFLLVDASPVDIQPLNELMKYVTVRAGHFEVNYGDAHFRRTDNGNAMYNPLVGNYIMDAFTTEIGAEVYVRPQGALQGLLAMGGITAGESKGMVQNPQRRAPAFLGKVGIDREFGGDLRIRLTGSAFTQAQATNQTLFSGDRAGSRYYSVLETTTDEAAAPTSGTVNPGFNSIHAYVINPFVKFGGLELFGSLERVSGRTRDSVATRTWTQNVGEALYRFAGDRLYGAARFNNVAGRLNNVARDVSIRRSQFGGGWFLTPNIMTKLEYVKQKYSDFPTADVRSGGRFQGYVLEGVVAF